MGSSGITKLHFAQISLQSSLSLWRKRRGWNVRTSRAESVFLVSVKHTHTFSGCLILLLFHLLISLDLFRRQSACDTQFCTFCVRNASGHRICIYIYTYIVSAAAMSNEKTITIKVSIRLICIVLFYNNRWINVLSILYIYLRERLKLILYFQMKHHTLEIK